MYLTELRAIRERAADFVAEIDKALGKFSKDETEGFIGVVETKRSGLGGMLRDGIIEFTEDGLRIELDPRQYGFVILWRAEIREAFREYSGRKNFKLELLKR